MALPEDTPLIHEEYDYFTDQVYIEGLFIKNISQETVSDYIIQRIDNLARNILDIVSNYQCEVFFKDNMLENGLKGFDWDYSNAEGAISDILDYMYGTKLKDVKVFLIKRGVIDIRNKKDIETISFLFSVIILT